MGRRAAILVLPVLLLVVAACGGSSGSAEPAGEPPAAEPAPPEVAPTPPPPAVPPPIDATDAEEPPADESGESEQPGEPPAEPAPAVIEQVLLDEIAVLDVPVELVSRPGDERLFVAEKRGVVQVLSPTGEVRGQPFLDLSDRTSTESEQGLIGMTFSPDGERFYAHHSTPSGEGRVASWPVVDGELDLSGEVEHLFVFQPFANHNGGKLAFGPDGFLYVALGDGGSGGDPMQHGQNTETLLGSLLRIDPVPDPTAPYAIPSDNPFADGGGAPEVWAYGLRNPWKFSFDRETGDLWIADVGQDAIEEVDFLPAGAPGGANFGWRALEGSQPFDGPAPDDAVPPVFEYGHDLGNSVTGGHVYRGSAIPTLTGQYVFGDFGSGFVAALAFDPNGEPIVQGLPIEVPLLTSFGEGPDGELYTLSAEGPVSKLVPVG